MPDERGEAPPTFNEEVRMWNLIAGNFISNVLFRSIAMRYCTTKRATLIESFVHISYKKFAGNRSIVERLRDYEY